MLTNSRSTCHGANKPIQSRSRFLFDGDETFAHLRFAAGYVSPLPALSGDTTVRAELWGQWSNDSLPGVEKFYLGGRFDERGYVFAETEGDSGVSATLEIGHDIYPKDAGRYCG